MRRVFLAGLLLLCALPAQAQRTTVTGTVTDPNSIPYANGTIKAILVPTGGNPTLNGAQIPGTYGPTPLDANGALIPLSLPDNNVISPGGTQYVFTVCETPGILPPEGFGSVCFDSPPITITGASQSITVQLTAAAKALGRVTAGGAVKVNNVSVAAANFIDSLSIMWAVAAPNVSASPVGIGPIAQKPTAGQTGDAICYASRAGNDTNDGLSWGTAKLTVTGCWTAVPQQVPSLVSGGGTIFTSSGAANGNPLGETFGLRIAGFIDPNSIWTTGNGNGVASLVRSANVVVATLNIAVPAYYVMGANISVFDAQNTTTGAGTGDVSFNGNFTLTAVNAGAKTLTWSQTGANVTVNNGGIILEQGWLPTLDLSVVCAAGVTTTANGHIPKCAADWGDNTHPAIQISGSANPLLFQGFQIRTGKNAAALGIDSNGSRNGTGGSSGITFRSVDFSNSTCAGCGPGVDIGSNTFWVRFDDCVFQGNPNATAGILSDAAQAMTINPGSGSGSGLIFVTHSNTNTGGIKQYTQSAGGGLYVDGLSTENNIEAAVWVTAPSSSSTLIRVRNVEVSDCTPGGGGTSPHCDGVRVDAGQAPTDAVVVENIAAPVVGPMLCLGGCYAVGYSTQVISSLRQGQGGFFAGTPQGALGGTTAPEHIEGVQDEALGRTFSPVATRFTPLTNTGSASTSLPGSWTTFGGTGTITLVTAPDGTTNAGRLTQTSGTFNVQACCGAAITPVVGEWYITSVWARSQTANGFHGNQPIQFQWINNNNILWQSTGTGVVFVSQFIQGDGEWRKYYTAQKISATDGLSGNLLMFLNADSTHTLDYYNPCVIRIGNAVLSDNEALEYALGMQCPSGTAAPGDVSMLPTQRFRMSVPGANFQYLWQGVPTADAIVTLPPNPGTLLGAGNGVGQLMQTKRVAGCATGAVLGNTCDTTVTWTNAFADTNYTVTCTGAAITSGTPELVGHSISAAKTASAITVRTVNNSAAAAQFTNIECVAVHD